MCKNTSLVLEIQLQQILDVDLRHIIHNISDHVEEKYTVALHYITNSLLFIKIIKMPFLKTVITDNFYN